jgi:glycosyltransferase involved in cell wall biosynthesis
MLRSALRPIRSRVRKLRPKVRRLIRRLPPPFDEMAIGALRAIRSMRADPLKVAQLEMTRKAQYSRGEISESYLTLRAIRERVDSRERQDVDEHLLGRLRETDPHWLPWVPGPPRPVEPSSDVSVMHLLKESSPYHVNGFCMRSRYSLIAQRDAGLDPFVVTSLPFPRKDGVTEFPRVDDVDGIRHYRLDLGPGYPSSMRYDQLLRDYAWLAARIGRRERPAIIHAGSGFRGYEPALVGRALRAHLQRPLVYEVRSFFESTWTADLAASEKGEYYQRRFDTENRCMRAADVVITIAEAMKTEIIARGVPADRIFVVPNGVDPSAFTPKEKDQALARKYGVAGKPVFGYVSNLDHPREGQELLIEAAAILKAQHRDVACLIVGDGGRRAELEAKARSAGVRDTVIFTGRIPHEQVADLYALIDVFVVPRRDERAARLVTPLKPYEAMALGKAVVVSDLPPLVELAKPGERGLAYEPENAAALAATVARLFDDAALRERLAETGRNWVRSERSWASNGERYREAYRLALEMWTSRRDSETAHSSGEAALSSGEVA